MRDALTGDHVAGPGVHDRIRFARWLAEDLDDIADPAAVSCFMAFVDRLTIAYDNERSPLPASVTGLRAASERIAGTPGALARLRLLNRTLRRFFVETTLTDDSYADRRITLGNRAGETLGERPGPHEPLPVRHTAVVFRPDPRAPDQCERAASLTMAALRVTANASRGGTHYGAPQFARTIVSAGAADRLVDADEETRILVLTRGIAYGVWLGRNAAALDGSDLADIFAHARADASLYIANGNAWLEGVPAYVTASARGTASRIRRLLERDPENARGLAIIDRCSFAVCLDTPGATAPHAREPAATERLAGRMLANVANRWYGMTNLVVDVFGHAALVGPCLFDDDEAALIACASTIFERSLAIATNPAELQNRPARWRERAHVERITFRNMPLGNLGADAAQDVASCFHTDRSLYDFDLGTSFFRAFDAPASATLHYALALAARDAFGTALLPAIVHPVPVRDASGEIAGVDWINVSTAGSQALLRAVGSPQTSLVTPIAHAGRGHAARVAAAQAGHAPARFLRPPDGAIDELVYEFFAEVGERFSSDYRGQLFGVLGGTRAADIASNLVRIPQNIRFSGRPGARSTNAGLFAVDIELGADRARLCFMPASGAEDRIDAVCGSLEALASRLRKDANVLLRRL